jgi:NADPH:quinone reductase-like Zn-dependent oxidoreductase
MRLYRFPKTGSIDDLTLDESDIPAPGRRQVLVRLRAASLNYRDLMVATGRYARGRAPANLVPLSDGAGEVAAVGPEVTRVKAGDRVAGAFMQSWIGGEVSVADHASALGGAVDGVLAEYRLFDEEGLVLLPEALSYEEGAALPCAGVTAWNALYGARPLQPGEDVLVLGTGGVSILALQFAHAAGARVIATSSSDEKLARAAELGATELINYRKHADWEAEVLRLTAGRGVDHVLEVGGAGTLPLSLRAVRMGGRISLIGVLTGGASQVNPLPILMKNVRVQGIYVGSREMFEAMNRAIALHKLRPVVDRVFAFKEIQEALPYMESGGHFGKICIRI